MVQPTHPAIRATDCAAALVTASLEEQPDRTVINELLREAAHEGYIYDLTVALAFGFAANVEGIATMIGKDPHELWQSWCQQEAEQRSYGRPFNR